MQKAVKPILITVVLFLFFSVRAEAGVNKRLLITDSSSLKYINFTVGKKPVACWENKRGKSIPGKIRQIGANTYWINLKFRLRKLRSAGTDAKGRRRYKRFRKKMIKMRRACQQSDPDPTPNPSSSATPNPSPTADPTSSPTSQPSGTPYPSPQPTFNPEGFGAVTEGAKSSPGGYETYHVTNLSDSGPGSFRDAVSQASRYIVFDVGGTITLQSDLEIRYSYVTVDGGTAPSPGITIMLPAGVGTVIEAHHSTGAVHDVIIHKMRLIGPGGHDNTSDDIWGLDGEAEPVYNIIIDHVTGTAANDGVFDIWGNVHDVTISWNLITDTICALHLSRSADVRQRISFHHNVFARNNERQIRMRHDNRLIDFVNNIIYGWGWFEGGAYGLGFGSEEDEIKPSVNVINNLFHYVSGLYGDPDDAVMFRSSGDVGDIYFGGNSAPAGETDMVSTSGYNDIPAYAQVTTYGALDLKNNVLPHVGTHYRTADEENLISQIESDI